MPAMGGLKKLEPPCPLFPPTAALLLLLLLCCCCFGPLRKYWCWDDHWCWGGGWEWWCWYPEPVPPPKPQVERPVELNEVVTVPDPPEPLAAVVIIPPLPVFVAPFSPDDELHSVQSHALSSSAPASEPELEAEAEPESEPDPESEEAEPEPEPVIPPSTDAIRRFPDLTHITQLLLDDETVVGLAVGWVAPRAGGAVASSAAAAAFSGVTADSDSDSDSDTDTDSEADAGAANPHISCAEALSAQGVPPEEVAAAVRSTLLAITGTFAGWRIHPDVRKGLDGAGASFMGRPQTG